MIAKLLSETMLLSFILFGAGAVSLVVMFAIKDTSIKVGESTL